MKEASAILRKSNTLSIILGAITLLIFAAMPYILDLIAPAKSIGQVVGENAKDMIDGLLGNESNAIAGSSSRNTWTNILTILGFVFFIATIVLTLLSSKTKNKKNVNPIGAALAVLGLAIFFYTTALSTMATIIVGVLALGLVTIIFVFDIFPM